MFNNFNNIYKTTIEEENIEELQRQKSIIEILLSKDEALYLLNKVEEKKDQESTQDKHIQVQAYRCIWKCRGKFKYM